MQKKHDYKVDIDRKDIPFHSIKFRVLHPYFYLGDGISALLLRDVLGKRNAKTISYGQTHFTGFIPVDRTRFVVKGYSTKPGQNILGVLHTHKDVKVLESHEELLENQIGGVIATRMACPDAEGRHMFVSATPETARYNGRMPIVIYVPTDYEVKFKIYQTDGDDYEALEVIHKQ